MFSDHVDAQLKKVCSELRVTKSSLVEALVQMALDQDPDFSVMDLVTQGKRGRPALTEEEKAERAAQRMSTKVETTQETQEVTAE